MIYVERDILNIKLLNLEPGFSYVVTYIAPFLSTTDSIQT